MTTLNLTIHTNNDAFNESRNDEVARILEDTARRLRHEAYSFGNAIVLRDINGNTVGTAAFEDGD